LTDLFLLTVGDLIYQHWRQHLVNVWHKVSNNTSLPHPLVIQSDYF